MKKGIALLLIVTCLLAGCAQNGAGESGVRTITDGAGGRGEVPGQV